LSWFHLFFLTNKTKKIRLKMKLPTRGGVSSPPSMERNPPKSREAGRRRIILWAFLFVLVGAAINILILHLYSHPPIQTYLAVPIRKTEIKKVEISPEIKQFGIKIDKIDVLAPILENVDGTEKAIYNKALQSGVAHYKGTALPEQNSNIFIFGHSSSVLGIGPYANIFANLNELDKGDTIVIYYKEQEFHYIVFEKKIIGNDDLSVLEPTKKEQLTLMTCWPIGSKAKRLIIKSYLEKQ